MLQMLPKISIFWDGERKIDPTDTCSGLSFSSTNYTAWNVHKNKELKLLKDTVETRYLELAYFELPLISKWKSGPYFYMKLWQHVTK